MKTDCSMLRTNLAEAAASAARAEMLGYDGVWASETKHDPFLPLALAAEHTSHVDLGTSVAIAFARNPMNLASLGHDLQSYSAGRFILGLGSQIKPHITKRFSMTWSEPARRMRELILAMRAIWDCWNEDAALDFRGDFYTHTLMTPFFNPGPSGFGRPRVFLAGVGEGMTQVAGEVADGFLCHGFTTAEYLREVTLPALDRGLSAGGRTRGEIEVNLPVFVVSGEDERQIAEAAEKVRQQLAFYASTPAYRNVLVHHGWGDLQDELHRASKQGRWQEMGLLIDDSILQAFAVVGPLDEIASRIVDRFGHLIDRITIYSTQDGEADRWLDVMRSLKERSSPADLTTEPRRRSSAV